MDRIQKSLFILLTICIPLTTLAKEGMWLPQLLKSLNADDMRTMGMEISAEDIYSVNNSSLKDAIVHFGGGCTAEVISNKGLILTNHHCGYSRIQSHSTVENDYLKNGFWAETMDDELKNPGLTATFIERIEDVTERVMDGITDTVTEGERKAIVSRNIRRIEKKATDKKGYGATIKPFDHGNKYYMFITKTYTDVRMVAAPPSSIGKFGGDEDNWMWPRHTGDFSVFRIYADKNNDPAKPSDKNVPYQPDHVLPISLQGIEPGDFAMIYGFPGRTNQYIPSDQLKYIMEKNDPARIEIRDASLDVIEQAMKQSDELRIMYSGKQSSISNYHKKWQGEITGLKRIDALEEKKQFEQRFRKKVRENGNKEYKGLLDSLISAYEQHRSFDLARDYFIEFMYYGPDMIRFVNKYEGLVRELSKLKESGELDSTMRSMQKRADNFFENHDMEVDEKIFKAQIGLYRKGMPKDLLPGSFKKIDKKYDGDSKAFADKMYQNSLLLDKGKLDELHEILKKGKGKKKLKKDPALQFVNSLYKGYALRIKPGYDHTRKRVDSLMRVYISARKELFPDKDYWYDANGTLRVSYGKIAGSEPRDGIEYEYRTTLKGVMEKHDPDKKFFNVPEKLIQLYEEKDFGPYDDNGTMPVCFTSSLHTSGGNSGSPIIDAKGRLIGLNFDRSWESVMSDLEYDKERCRNISVDIRYVLLILDKFAGMDRLIKEMKIEG